MRDPLPRTIDMTASGAFVAPPPRPVWALRLGLGAAAVAAVAASLVVASLFLWIASLLLPVVLVAGVLAYAMLRFRRWRL